MKSAEQIPQVLIVAGEASSALYATRLLEHWRGQGRRVHGFGVGSQAMVDLGFEALGRSENMAVVGIQEVLAHYKEIKATFNELLLEAKRRRPRFALLLDYPDFNLRLAKQLKAMGIRVIYYISPQLWAWRKGRIRQVQDYVDKMLVVFPFEVEFYKQYGVDVSFVGHPLLDELEDSLFDPQARAQERACLGWSAETTVIGLMPGSRRSEIQHHLETQIATAHSVRAMAPHVQFALLVAPGLRKEDLERQLAGEGLPITLLNADPFTMIRLMDIILTASGTATLMVGLMRVPMVIMYKMNRLSAWLARRLVGMKYFGMVNLVLGREVVPERFQESATPEELSQLLVDWVQDDQARVKVSQDLGHLREALGHQGATVRVAELLEAFF